jgi:protein-disulfide isomerase
VLSDEVWKVPVFPDDPVKGAKDALVTIVAFSEFESPFCKRGAETLERILAAYPNDVRLVWKDNPLPFSSRAKPAAILARAVYAERGVEGFWQTHDHLFAAQPKLGDEALELVTNKLGVPWSTVKAAIDSNRYIEKIDQSIELGGDVEVRGTPHFFINGRRFAGAQPFDKFKQAVDQALAQASARVARGTPRAEIYAVTIRDGRTSPALARKDVPPPEGSSPIRGDAAAKIVIQQFAEFPCTSCERIARTLEDIEAEYRGRVKVAWRFMVPPDDASALLVAEVALEAFAQRGSAAFLTFHERVLDAKQRGESLDETTLIRIATETSMDASRLKRALASGKHKQRIREDSRLASKVGITTSPSFVINGAYVDENEGYAVFKKAINSALREH